MCLETIPPQQALFQRGNNITSCNNITVIIGVGKNPIKELLVIIYDLFKQYCGISSDD